MNLSSDAGRQPRAIVIGGGIAGLAAAIRIRALSPAAVVTIIDSAPRLGGKISGEVIFGCVVDGGADVCIGDKLRTTHLFAELGLADSVIRANPHQLPTYQWRDGCLQPMQSGFDGELLTFAGGMSELVARTCAGLAGIDVCTGTSAVSLTAEHSGWRVGCADGSSHIGDAIVVATPATVAGALLAGIAPEPAAALRELEYPATTTVSMAWHTGDVARPLDATGYLVADLGVPVSACTWCSAKNPSHAARDVALLRCYIRGDTGDAAALMRDEVARVLGISASPLFTRVYRWPAGIPLYTTAHAEAVRAITGALQTAPGLYIAGSSFHGVGIPDCVHSGERAGADVVSYLLGRPRENAA